MFDWQLLVRLFIHDNFQAPRQSGATSVKVGSQTDYRRLSGCVAKGCVLDKWFSTGISFWQIALDR